jgi:hypothetical protein
MQHNAQRRQAFECPLLHLSALVMCVNLKPSNKCT